MDQSIIEQTVSSNDLDTEDTISYDLWCPGKHRYYLDRGEFTFASHYPLTDEQYESFKYGSVQVGDNTYYNVDVCSDIVWYMFLTYILKVDCDMVEHELNNYFIHSNDDGTLEVHCEWCDDQETIYKIGVIYDVAHTIYSKIPSGYDVHIERIYEEFNRYPSDQDFENIIDTIESDYSDEVEEANK